VNRLGKLEPILGPLYTSNQYLNFYLRKETCVERHHLGHGKSVRGPGFLSLLGALYLQMSNFQDAEEITYCKWCGEVVDLRRVTVPQATPQRVQAASTRCTATVSTARRSTEERTTVRTSSTTRGRRKLRRDPEKAGRAQANLTPSSTPSNTG
jgi:hypothetical protein